MKDFIKKLIERLEENGKCYARYSVNTEGVKSIPTHEAISIVNELAEEYNNGWIACSERLPEVNTTYLVSLEGYCKPLMAWFGSDKEWYWYNSTAKMDYVLAWQPLPEPYQPKGE